MPTTIFTSTQTGADSGNEGLSLRNVAVITGGALDQIRVTFKTATNASGKLVVDNASVGISNGTASQTTATPTRLTFNGGANNFSITGNGVTQVSDWINFNGFTSSDKLVVTMDINSGVGNGGPSRDDVKVGSSWYFVTGATFSQANPAGMTLAASDSIEGISLIEVQSSSAIATVTRRYIFTPNSGPKRGLRSAKAFPIGGAITTLTASTGTFTLTGIASLFRINDVVVKGTFTETGIATLFRISETSAKGTFTETGIASLFRINEVVSKGTFTLTGIAAQQARPSPTGTFTLTGKAALFQFDAPEIKGTFVLSGNAANLTPTLSSSKGTFVETGKAAVFQIDEIINKGTYVLSGKDAILTDTGAATPAALNNWIVDRLRRRINASKN